MMQPLDRSCRRAAALVSAAAAMLSHPVLAQQSAAQISQAIVQAVPVKSAGMRLNDALNRLARSPADVEALIAAGRASLDLGDVQAAIGFYRRAETLWPGSARIKAGLAGAYTLGDDPVTAIGMFGEAEKLGPIDADRTADRALAYDLVGDGQTAQRFYRQSIALAATDEAQRRMAVSLAIAGDRRGMESLLSPLLQRQDKAAWRTRAFALAILGQVDEAESIVRQTMPADKAAAMANYLRYMPRLTGAQQAGAANLGHFPRAAEIGQDDPRIAPFARARVKLAAVQPAVVPAKPESKKDQKRKARELEKAATLAAATLPARLRPAALVIPPVSRGPAGPSAELAPLAPVAAPRPLLAPIAAPVAAPSSAPIVKPAPVPLPATLPPVSALVPAPARVAAAALPGIVLRPAAIPSSAATPGPGFAMIDPSPAPPPVTFDLRNQTPAPVVPALSPAPAGLAPAAPKPDSLDDAFADFTPPSREVEPQSGAVDVRQVRQQALAAAAKDAADALAAKGKDKAARDKALKDKALKDKALKDKAAKDAKEAKDAKAAELTQPSRVWVQVATGRDKTALGSDWRKLVKNDPEVFKAKKPFVTAWGQANRLLAGPFGSQKDAAAFLAALKKAGVGGGFIWSSPAGQAVDPLGGGK